MVETHTDFAASMAPIMDGRLILICATEANARPWVRLLTEAGLTVTKLPPPGRYSFTFDARPDLTAETPAAIPAPATAPAMLALLRQLLALYDGQRLAPPETYADYWAAVRAAIRPADQIEG